MKAIQYYYKSNEELQARICTDITNDWNDCCNLTKLDNDKCVLLLTLTTDAVDCVRKSIAAFDEEVDYERKLEWMLMKPQLELAQAYDSRINVSVTISMDEIKALILGIVIFQGGELLIDGGLDAPVLGILRSVTAFLCGRIHYVREPFQRCAMLTIARLSAESHHIKFNDIVGYRNERVCPHTGCIKCKNNYAGDEVTLCNCWDQEYEKNMLNALDELYKLKAIDKDISRDEYFIPGIIHG